MGTNTQKFKSLDIPKLGLYPAYSKQLDYNCTYIMDSGPVIIPYKVMNRIFTTLYGI